MRLAKKSFEARSVLNAPGIKGEGRTIDGELVAKSVVGAEESRFGTGERVFHMKFGYGEIIGIDGNKLTIQFDKAGRSECWIRLLRVLEY